MSEPIGRTAPSTSGGLRAGGSRGPIRKGFEVYTPAARGAARRAAEAAASGVANGHDTARGRGLWDDTSEDPGSRVPKGDAEWKRDRWNEDVPQTSMVRSGRGGMRGAAITDSRSPPTGPIPRGRGVRGASGNGGGGGGIPRAVEPEPVHPEVPSGEQFEDISRKVEEEVVAKLARAQVMGMMFKAHREQEEERRGSSRGGGGSGNGAAGANARRRRGDRSDSVAADGGEHVGDRGRSTRGGGAISAAGDTAAPRIVTRPVDAVGRGGGKHVGRIAVGGSSVPAVQANMQSLSSRHPPLTSGTCAGMNGMQSIEMDDHQRQMQMQMQLPDQSGVVASELSLSRPGGFEAYNRDGFAAGHGMRAPVDSGDPLRSVGTAPGLLRIAHEDLSAASAQAPEHSGAEKNRTMVEEAYSVVGKLERELKALIEEIRKDVRSSGSVLVRPGPGGSDAGHASGAALSAKVARVRDTLSRTLGSLIRKDAVLSLRKRLPNRLWMAHYREMEVVQHGLRLLANNSTGGGNNSNNSVASKQKVLRSRLLELIEKAEHELNMMVSVVEEQVSAAEDAKATASMLAIRGNADAGENLADSDTDSSDDDDEASEECRGRQQALQVFLTHLGDLARYRSLYGDHGRATAAAGTSGSWARAEALYERALRVDPDSGKVWNQMAVLWSCHGDNLAAFYAYLRGVCASSPFPGAREQLLILHEKCKDRLSTLREATALDALGIEEHQARFRLYLLGACGTCLSRVDLGTFDGYLALAERHMVSCVQLYVMRSSSPPGAAEPEVENGPRGLEGALARAIILSVCTASASFDGWRSRGMEGGSWTQDAATSSAVRLCLSLAGALAGLHRRTSARGWEKLTAAGVGIFLDWLVCRPQFGEGTRGTSLEEFQHVMACVVEFANGVIRAAATESASRLVGRNAFSSSRARALAAAQAKAMLENDVDPDGPLWEDEECRGLPALEITAERRASKVKKRARSAAKQRQQEQEHGSSVATSVPSYSSSERGRLAGTSRGGRRGGGRGGRRGGRGPGGSMGGKSPRSLADEEGMAPGGGGDSTISVVPVDPWRTRVARIRRQVEFCVERGWIARGGRPGTYTLPKPPPKPSPRSSPLPPSRADDYDAVGMERSASVAGLSDEGRNPQQRGLTLGEGGRGGREGGGECSDPDRDLEGFSIDEEGDRDRDDKEDPSSQQVRGRGSVQYDGGTGISRMPSYKSGGADSHGAASREVSDERLHGESAGLAGNGAIPDHPVAANAGSRTRQPRVPIVPPEQHQGILRQGSAAIGGPQPLSTPATTGVSVGDNRAMSPSMAVAPVLCQDNSASYASLQPGEQGALCHTDPSPRAQARAYSDAEASAVAGALSSMHLQMIAHEVGQEYGQTGGVGLSGHMVGGDTIGGGLGAIGQGNQTGGFGATQEAPAFTPALGTEWNGTSGELLRPNNLRPVPAEDHFTRTLEGVHGAMGSIGGIGGFGGIGSCVLANADGQIPSVSAPGMPNAAPPSSTLMPSSVADGNTMVTGAANQVAVNNTADEGISSKQAELPDSLLDIVLAGLGAADENLCPFCCSTLSPGLDACSTCFTPVAHNPPAGVSHARGSSLGCLQPAITAAAAPAASERDRAVVASSAGNVDVPSPIVTVDPLQASGVGVGVRAEGLSGVKSPAPAAALPAGVLAVNNLAEVIASSQRPVQPTLTTPAGGQKGSARARAHDPDNPTVIARAGLGDGGGQSRSGGIGASTGKSFGWPRGAPRASALPLVVIDVPNVAMRHGLKKKFSCKGVRMAIEYFRTAGHRVVGFLPDYYLDEKVTNGLDRAQKLGVAEVKASRLPDDVPLLRSMVDDGLLISTPPQDYDDSYSIKYAMAKHGYVVTNDLYRDHVKGIEGRKKADAARRWIKTHSISYTFVGDEFFPNPDFSFHQDQGGAA